MTNYREILRLHSLGLNKTEMRQAADALGTLWQQPYSGQQTAACNGRCRRKCRISSSQSVCFHPAPQSLSTI